MQLKEIDELKSDVIKAEQSCLTARLALLVAFRRQARGIFQDRLGTGNCREGLHFVLDGQRYSFTGFTSLEQQANDSCFLNDYADMIVIVRRILKNGKLAKEESRLSVRSLLGIEP